MAASEIEQWWIDKFQENLGSDPQGSRMRIELSNWPTSWELARQTVSNLETGQKPDDQTAVSRFTYGVQRRDRTS